MKKNYFLAKAFAVAAFIGAANSASAQYYTESFSYADTTSFDANWATLNSDGNTPDPSNALFGTRAWLPLDESILPNAYADTAAAANSWYSPAGQSDDWMWTVNSIDLSTATAPRMDWTSYSNSAGFDEDYEVYIATTNTDFGPATSLTPVATITETSNTETAHFVDLTAFAGQSVYIAFRQVSNDDDILLIDDIVIAEAPTSPDLVTTATPVEYTKYPLSQVANIVGTASVGNTGGDATGVAVTVNVWDISGPTNVFTETTTAQDINGASSANYTFGSFTPSAVGTYAVEMIAIGNEIDANGTNDTAYYFVQVTDSTYARDDADINGLVGTLGIGAGAGQDSRLGQTFEIITQDTLTSVDIWISNAYNGTTGNLNGQPLRMHVYDFSSGPSTTVLASTEAITLDTTTSSFWTCQFANSVVLPAGIYQIAVEENDSNISVGRTGGVYTPNTVYIKWNSNAGGAWTSVDAFPAGFHTPYVIRPNFGTPIITTGVNELTTEEWEVFPNPATNNIFVKNAKNGSTIEIYNNLGQLVITEVLRSNNAVINITDLDNGVYTIKNTSNEEVSTQSFVKQ